jgi:hypothetical protein
MKKNPLIWIEDNVGCREAVLMLFGAILIGALAALVWS